MKRVLPIIVISQFLCTSLWFAGNAILPDIINNLHLNTKFLAHLTSAVQFGFITGTLIFAVLTISDRFSPSRVFFTCSILAALANLVITLEGIQSTGLLLSRFITGFFLAGIYPIGMKIASDYYQKGLGKSLGFLVGALVIGTALPHLLKNITAELPWNYVIYATSSLSILGGLSMFLFVPDGPYRRAGQKLKLNTFLTVFKNRNFQSAALGYFGHMWELYAFWAFVPVMLSTYKNHFHDSTINTSLFSFLVIALGGVACVSSGLLSQKFNPKKIASIALTLSCLCCITSPLFMLNTSAFTLLLFLFFWGFVVIADSPLFSTLVAQNAPEESRGTSLTIVNCIGFLITIISIQFITAISSYISPQYLYMLLAIGPILGLIALFTNREHSKSNA
jgi:MFS family permease